MSERLPFENLEVPRIDRPRVLLDTNIWRYVADAKSAGMLISIARSGKYHIQIAPAVLYETLRIRDHALRATIVKAMTNERLSRLMTEAYSESMEILSVRPRGLRVI